MIDRFLVFLLVACVFFSSQGCTYRAWYEGFQEQQRQNCYKYSSQSEIQRCLDKANNMTYEQYKMTREASKKQDE